MKSDSPLFDRIRVKPDQDRRKRDDRPLCEWPDCTNTSSHRAPKGRGQEKDYWNFCLDHVREYNHSYNYFKGMSEDAVASYQKDALTGHLPTWKMGMVGGKCSAWPGRPDGADDPFGLFDADGAPRRKAAPPERERTVHNAARKAFQQLGLEAGATRTLIKARFKELVKRHHPDANGGDKSFEDKLREVIDAYNYLKSAGFC